MADGKAGEKALAGGMLLLGCLLLISEIARPFSDMSFRPLVMLVAVAWVAVSVLSLRALFRK
jgi:hypothetical protein